MDRDFVFWLRLWEMAIYNPYHEFSIYQHRLITRTQTYTAISTAYFPAKSQVSHRPPEREIRGQLTEVSVSLVEDLLHGCLPPPLLQYLTR